MSVIYINPRLGSVECGQLIDCTPLVRNSAVSVKLVVCHDECFNFYEVADNILAESLRLLKKNFPFVCVQACSYNYNVVYRITFVTSSIRNIEKRLHNFVDIVSQNFSSFMFYFDY